MTVQVPGFVDTNGTRFVSAGWTGTGSIPTNGTTNSVTFTLLADSTLTWNWTPFVLTANSISQPAGPQFLLQWPSTPGKTYDLLFTTNLSSTFAPIATNLPATPPTNTYQAPLTPTPATFYRIEMK